MSELLTCRIAALRSCSTRSAAKQDATALTDLMRESHFYRMHQYVPGLGATNSRVVRNKPHPP